MIVVCNSMPKSASTVLFIHTRDLVRHAFRRNGQRQLTALTAAGEIEGVNAFVKFPDEAVMDRLLELSRRHGPIVLKTHREPTPVLERLLRAGQIKMIFSHRDPRDMILSAMDHRVRAEREGKAQFVEFPTVAESMASARWACQMACQWQDSNLACVFRYVDIVRSPERVLERVCRYLDLGIDRGVITEMVERERKTREQGMKCFNRGDFSRYQREMTAQQIELCSRELGDYIRELGYPLDESVPTNDAGGDESRPAA